GGRGPARGGRQGSRGPRGRRGRAIRAPSGIDPDGQGTGPDAAGAHGHASVHLALATRGTATAPCAPRRGALCPGGIHVSRPSRIFGALAVTLTTAMLLAPATS